MKKIFTSRTVFLALCVLITIHRFWPAWGPGFDNGRMLRYDSFGYYSYLPAVFIYNDAWMENRDWLTSLQERYTPSETPYQFAPGKDGRQVIKYPSGMAIVWSPFFFVAHVIAEPLGFPADGLSPPYSWSILIGCLLYAFIGLYFLRKVFLHFFPDGIAAALLVLIALGTNYWASVASETVMPHSSVFAANSVLLWLIIRWHADRRMKHLLFFALLYGISVLMRPTQILWIVPFGLWNVRSWSSLVAKVRLFMVNYKQVIPAGAVALAVVILQPVYWKITTGYFRYHGYDERFSFLDPFITECLVSYKKGWLLYTPLVIFMFAGFYFMWKQRREIFWPVLMLTILHCWFIMSWETWWYASSFSLRGAVELYPALALPLGFLLTALRNSRRVLKIAAIALLVLIVVLNLFQHWQFNHGIIDGERMSKAYYWRVFGKTKITVDDVLLLEVDRHPVPEVMPPDAALLRTDHFLLAFEAGNTFTGSHIVNGISHSGAQSLQLDSANAFGPMYQRVFHGSSEEYAWVRASAWIMLTDSSVPPPQLLMSFHARGRDLRYKSITLDTTGLRRGEWKQISGEMITPVSLYTDDEIRCVIWNVGGRVLYIDDFVVEVYEPFSQRN